jgi:hypothetical protein
MLDHTTLKYVGFLNVISIISKLREIQKIFEKKSTEYLLLKNRGANYCVERYCLEGIQEKETFTSGMDHS